MTRPNNTRDVFVRGKDSLSLLTSLLAPRETEGIFSRARIVFAARFLVVVLMCVQFFFGTVFAPSEGIGPKAQAVVATGSERDALEQQLKQVEAEIAVHEATIATLQTQGSSLKGEIKKLNEKVAKLALQIKAITYSLIKLDSEILTKQGEIKTAEEKIEIHRDGLAYSLEALYEFGDTNMVETLLTHTSLTEFADTLNTHLSVEDSLAATIGKITELRSALVDEKELLAAKRDDAKALKAFQDRQRRTIEETKKEKNNLLTETKGKESQFQEIVKDRKKLAAQIRSRIFEFLGGGQLTFEQAYQFAKAAENITGVRAALILAVLDRESRLGLNVGKCTYQTAMHPTRDIPHFLALVATLNINPNSVSVSCANKDGAYGGAMGPAQFIPSTWNIYKAEIAQIIGISPASPWNNSAAFTGTGLYLRDSGAVKPATLSEERIAAAKYYAGKRWKTHLWGYGDRVVTRAEQFQKDIDLLNA